MPLADLPLTNEELGDLLEPGRPKDRRQNYEQVLARSLRASEDLMERFYLPAGFRPTAAGLVWLQDLQE